jgi:hypothetical protein
MTWKPATKRRGFHICVTPAQAGVHVFIALDARLRGHDIKETAPMCRGRFPGVKMK